MRPRIRRAAPEDIPFLSWVMFTAARSHLERCLWETILDEIEARVRDLLDRVVRTDRIHCCHASRFWIAELMHDPKYLD